MPADRPVSRRLTILDLLLLTAGEAVGIWLVVDEFDPRALNEDVWLNVLIFGLGGVSIVGPPLLLWRRFRGGWKRTRLRLGELFWFCQGTASWLLWPPMIYYRARGKSAMGGPSSAICFFYGTPLMALFIVLTLLAGGWLGPRTRSRRRRARPRSWTEVFGLLLGLTWACTGLYVLSVLYKKDFFE